MKKSSIIVAAMVVGVLSALFHLPQPYFSSSFYSDIVSVYHDIYPDTDRSRWYGEPRNYGLPYIDYKFEYPPLIGFLWSITTYVDRSLSGFGLINYFLNSLIIVGSFLFLVSDAYSIASLLRSSKWEPLYLIAAPSVIMYLVYNWDVIAISLAIRGLKYLLIEGDNIKSGIFIGLSGAAKIIPAVIGLPIIVELVRRRSKVTKDVVKFSSAYILGGAVPFVLLFIITPRGFFSFINHHSSWYLENSWYLMFTDNLWDPTLRSLSQFIVIASILISSLLVLNVPLKERMLVKSWLVTGLFVLNNYVYTPQMNLMIIPYLSIINPAHPILIFSFDMLNALIMIVWFSEKAWCDLLGISSRGPWYRESPVQWFSFARCLLLALILWETISISFIDRGNKGSSSDDNN